MPNEQKPRRRRSKSRTWTHKPKYLMTVRGLEIETDQPTSLRFRGVANEEISIIKLPDVKLRLDKPSEPPV